MRLLFISFIFVIGIIYSCVSLALMYHGRHCCALNPFTLFRLAFELDRMTGDGVKIGNVAKIKENGRGGNIADDYSANSSSESVLLSGGKTG